MYYLRIIIIWIDGLLYWSEWGDFKLGVIDKVNRTWISVENVKWRPIEKSMGEEEIYISNI